MRAASLREPPSKISASARQTTGKGGILALLGEGTKLKSCKIRPKGNRHRHGKSPLFAKINHAAADLKTHNKSAFQRRGISR